MGLRGAICYSEPDGFWVQSRKNIITPEKDNAGCAAWCYEREAQWMVLVEQLSEFHNIDLNKNIITIYFEFAGGNIQKNSCVSGFDKGAYIFEFFKVSPIEPSETEESKWFETIDYIDYVYEDRVGIDNIMCYKT